jgi:hypothetical protein
MCAGDRRGRLGRAGVGLGVAGTLHWSDIPARFAVHWGIDGQANGWAHRSVPGVLQFVALGLGLYFAMLVPVWQVENRARGSEPMRVYAGRILLATAYLIAFIFAASRISTRRIRRYSSKSAWGWAIR